jgi:enediyne biosynthesis protein E4
MDQPGQFTEPDDAQTQRALWRSALLLLVVVAAVLAVFFWQGQNQPMDADDAAAAEKLVPAVRFTDITREAGITFVHEHGAAGEKLLPETMGGGVAFFDFDGDGDQDLLFVNGTRWPWDATAGDSAPATATLYRNDTPPGGPVRFTDITAGSGLDVPLYGMGVAVADYDGDGLPDVYLTAVGSNRLFRNLGGGKFADVTAGTGAGGRAADWSTSAAFFDYDRDGDLDLFVCNYVRWNHELDLTLNYELAGIGRAYGPPLNFPGMQPYLFRNDGNGRFTEAAESAGLHMRNRVNGDPLGKSLGVAVVDLDNDGWLDLVVANDTVQNFVFRNQGDGTFKEMGAASGLALDAFGGTRGAMGIDAAPLDGQDQLAIAIGNFANEMTALYVAQTTPLLFSDEAMLRGIGNATRLSLTFGVFFFDYDLDGWLDLLTVNGHIEPEIERLASGQRFRQPAQLFWNNPAAPIRPSFIPVPASKSGEALHQPIVGRGSAYADIDGDGDLDVVLTQVGGPPVLLRNELNPANWVRLELVGSGGNVPAIGASVRFQHGGHSHQRLISPTRGYLSQSELPVTLPLERGREATIEIVWPDQSRQTVKVPGGGLRRIEPATGR